LNAAPGLPFREIMLREAEIDFLMSLIETDIRHTGKRLWERP
jgi:hypothetical protein